VALDREVCSQFQTPTDLVPTKAPRYRQNGRLRGPHSPHEQRVSSRTQAVIQPAAWSLPHWDMHNALGAVHTYRPSSFNGTHSQLMKSTRLCVKITQELRLTGMTNKRFWYVIWSSSWGLYLTVYRRRMRAHYMPVFTLSPHIWKHGGSKSSWSSLHTPCKFGQCGEKCWNTASCMYPQKEKSSGVRSEERSSQVIRPLMPTYFRGNAQGLRSVLLE